MRSECANGVFAFRCFGGNFSTVTGKPIACDSPRTHCRQAVIEVAACRFFAKEVLEKVLLIGRGLGALLQEVLSLAVEDGIAEGAELLQAASHEWSELIRGQHCRHAIMNCDDQLIRIRGDH